MSRLLDDLRGGSMAMPRFIPPQFAIRWESHARQIAQLLREDLPVILIDNVAEYFYETSDQEHWDIRDHFPNIAPPYGIWWMEHRVPRKIHSAKCGDTDVAALIPGGRVGFLFIGAPVADVKSEKLPANARWILAIEVFIDYGPALDNEIQGPHGTITMAIDEHGAIAEHPWMQSFIPAGDDFLLRLMQSILGCTHPALLAVSFLHCKNVRIEDHPVPPKLAKRYRERHDGLMPVAHQTLVIEPLKAILRSEGGAGITGLQRALHVCRGHFRDYREGRGLFGRYHQLVWQPSIVRGSKGSAPPSREITLKV